MFIRWMGRPLPARSGMSDLAQFAPHLCQAKSELIIWTIRESAVLMTASCFSSFMGEVC